ncbi:hypothetical protein GUJ93_ZPchr0013g35988 [Zizania palustris]|uniref:Uncharacterized protein n=1 Tax=Zizania palustris TaxID=103762 RepID=A0A8J6BZ14_ZIZPA|nr:hypothetical protein GUJ93_ZPchr0013g35988 [Zizania palustris]
MQMQQCVRLLLCSVPSTSTDESPRVKSSRPKKKKENHPIAFLFWHLSSSGAKLKAPDATQVYGGRQQHRSQRGHGRAICELRRLKAGAPGRLAAAAAALLRRARAPGRAVQRLCTQ